MCSVQRAAVRTRRGRAWRFPATITCEPFMLRHATPNTSSRRKDGARRLIQRHAQHVEPCVFYRTFGLGRHLYPARHSSHLHHVRRHCVPLFPRAAGLL